MWEQEFGSIFEGIYKQELRERFDECSIDPLTSEQAIGYASRELQGVTDAPTGVQFFHGIGEDLAQLVLNPLFLVMTVAVMKTKTGGKIPRNRAELYSDYADPLLEGWVLRGSVLVNKMYTATKRWRSLSRGSTISTSRPTGG